MDDFDISNLRESKDEWCCYLVDLLSPFIKQGIQSMFQQAWTLCVDKNETDKYLMTFQNLLTLISKWNSNTIEEERKRIVEQSGCSYLEELIVCVHIIHLKVMTHIRVGNRQKKIDISLPKLGDFIHKIYINCARQVYKNVYLFERNLAPLVQQKYNRELELIIQQAILTTVRDSIPKEQIIRSFLDENMEMEEEIVLEPTPVSETKSLVSDENVKLEETVAGKEEEPPIVVPSVQDVNDEKIVTQIKFNDLVDILETPEIKISLQDEPKNENQVDLGITDLNTSTTAETESNTAAAEINLLDIQEI